MTRHSGDRSGAAGPVQRAAACVYAYDASGLLARLAIPGQTGTRFWRGNRVVNELRTSTNGNTQLTWLRALGQPIVEQVSGAVGRLTLLATAISGSVLLEADTAVRTVAYAPHGSRPDGEVPESAKAEPAFNGEPLDAASGCYLLGAGHHRPYSPTLGMFLAPDSASPFGAGGLNSLSYCAGDPVNRADPTGHFWKWVVAAVGVAFGVAAVVASFGAASLAVSAVLAGGFAALTKSGAAAIAAVTLGTLAVGTEVGAAIALSAGDTKTGAILGWVGVGLGVVGSLPGIAKAAARGVAKLSRFSQRLGSVRAPRLSANAAPVRSASLPQLSPATARRTAVARMRNGGAFENGTSRRSSISSFRSTSSSSSSSSSASVAADGAGFNRGRRAGIFVAREETAVPSWVPPQDPSKTAAWTTQDWMIGTSDAPAMRVSAADHLQYMQGAVPEVLERSDSVRRAMAVMPPSYDAATLPSYASTLPTRYFVQGFF